MCVRACVWACMLPCVWIAKDNSWFSPSAMWVPGIQLRLLALMANAFTYCAILPTFECFLKKYTFYYVCARDVYVWAQVPQSAWRSDDNLMESVLLFHLSVGSRDWAWVSRFVWKGSLPTELSLWSSSTSKFSSLFFQSLGPSPGPYTWRGSSSLLNHTPKPVLIIRARRRL